MNGSLNKSPFDEVGELTDDAAEQIFAAIYDAYLIIRDNFTEDQQILADQYFNDTDLEISFIQVEYNSEEWESVDNVDIEKQCAVICFFSESEPDIYIVKALVDENFAMCLQWFSPMNEENQLNI